MKKTFILIQLFLLLSFGISSLIWGSDRDTVANNFDTEQANYMIGRYVIGSGGVMGADGSNYLHLATAGETFVGNMQGSNNFLSSGFWHPGPLRTELNENEAVNLPTTFSLQQNYPNPFNPQTAIGYDLPYRCLVTLEIFNIMGQRIRLLSSKIQGPGYTKVFWTGRDDLGKLMRSGIYLYRVTASKLETGTSDVNILFQQTKKMLLVK